MLFGNFGHTVGKSGIQKLDLLVCYNNLPTTPDICATFRPNRCFKLYHNLFGSLVDIVDMISYVTPCFSCIVPRRRSLVARGALCVMVLIVRDSLGVVGLLGTSSLPNHLPSRALFSRLTA